MKFSMKKDSPFRNNIFPWLIYGFGTGFYISLLLVKMIKRPELLSPWITILLAAAGIALGAVYMMYLKKKVTDLLALYFPVRNECRLLLYLYS